MAAIMKELGIDQLGSEERFALMQELWDSLSADIEQSPLTDAERVEVDRRLDAHRENPSSAVPWEQVEAEALDRLRK